MLQSRVVLSSAVVLSGIVASSLQAASVSYGPGIGFTTGGNTPAIFNNDSIFATPAAPFNAYAAKFTVADPTVNLTKLSVVINTFTSGTMTFKIVPDASGVPGTLPVAADFSFGTNVGNLVTGVYSQTVSPISLMAGSYWLVAQISSGAVGTWQKSNTSTPVGFQKIGTGSWVADTSVSTGPAFLLEGTSPIPLPASSMMGGALVLGLLARRKH